MFSTQDIRDIVHSLSPERELDAHSNGLPPLLISSTGDGFVTNEHAYREFERIVRDSESRLLLLADVAQELEIEPDAVLRFAKASLALVLLNQDNNIIPTKRKDLVGRQLIEQVAREVVSRPEFAQKHDISVESVDSLVQTSSSQEVVAYINDFLVSDTYQSLVSDHIKNHLDEALRESKPVEFGPKLITGAPPMWYISRTLNTTLEENNNALEFHTSESSDGIRCVPKESVLRKRDAKITELEAGQIPSLDLQDLLDEFKETYSSLTDVSAHLATLSDISLLGKRSAISNSWLSNFADGCVDAVKVLGYADLTSVIRATYPPDCHEELVERLEKHIVAAFPQQSDQPEIQKAGEYLVTSDRYDTDRSLLMHSASAHAAQQWEQLLETPDKEIKFQLSDMFEFIPAEQEILRALSEDRRIRKSVEETYWSEIAALETQNGAEFSTFWIERVVARVDNYAKALQAIEDEKLRDQLSQFLSSYITKELVPVSISKAQAKGLLRSRKTKKNVQRLTNSLQKAADLAGVLSAVEKFSKKQEVQDADTTSLETTKQYLLNDLVRKMQKQTDGPTLFLLLIIVLLAGCSEGVVYATGKFAPKLMKLLKPNLSPKQYEQLEKWKDMARASSLTMQDKIDMRNLAIEKTGGGLTV